MSGDAKSPPREVDQQDLITKAGKGLPLAKQGPAASKVLGSGDLAGIFGLEMAQGTWADPPKPCKARAVKKTKRSSSRAGKPAKKTASRRRPAKPGAS